MPWCNLARAPQLSLCSRAQEPKLLQPVCARARALQQEKPSQWEACALKLESSSCSPKLEESRAAAKTQHSHKCILFFFFKEALILRKKREREPSPFPVPMAWSRGQNLPVSNSGTRFLLPKPRASPIYQMMLTRLELNSFPESPEELDWGRDVLASSNQFEL